MGLNSVDVSVGAWEGDERERLTFPEDWKITVSNMVGHDRAPLTDEEIKYAISNPLGVPRFSELIAGKKRIAIIFDDLTRPTPAYRFLPFLLEDIHRAGIREDQISFVAAIGAHRPMTVKEFCKKLGAEVVKKYQIFNHNMYENLVDLGVTPLGIRLHVNREVMACDLKIGIGSIIPYWWENIFGGGAKIILPGISGRETIEAFHRLLAAAPKDSPSISGKDRVSLNEIWADLIQAAKMVNLDIKVDMVLNHVRDVIGLFIGDVTQTYSEGCAFGSEVYRTEDAEEADIVVINTYPQELQVTKSFWGAHASLREGGDVVIIARNSEGLGHLHYLTDRFGYDYGGAMWRPDFRLRLGSAQKIIFFVRNIFQNDIINMTGIPGTEVMFSTSWEEVITELRRRHGKGTQVAVYPYAPLQAR